MSLFDPGLEEAHQFVFRDYSKKQVPGKPNPKLGPVIAKVAKHFNAYGKESSQFSAATLTNYYVRQRLAEFNFNPTQVGRQMYLSVFGLDTLNGKLAPILRRWVENGNTEETLTAMSSSTLGGKRRHAALDGVKKPRCKHGVVKSGPLRGTCRRKPRQVLSAAAKRELRAINRMLRKR